MQSYTCCFIQYAFNDITFLYSALLATSYFMHRTGGALNTNLHVAALSVIGMKDAMHYSSDIDLPYTDLPEIVEKLQALTENKVIGQQASIAYHQSYHQSCRLSSFTCPSHVYCRGPVTIFW